MITCNNTCGIFWSCHIKCYKIMKQLVPQKYDTNNKIQQKLRQYMKLS